VTLTVRFRRTLTWIAIGGSTAFVILIVALLLEDGRKASLPEPSGPFAVGRVIEDWVDSAAVDPLAPVPGTRREDLVWIWYPAATPSTAPTDEYLPPPLRPKPDPSDARNPWTYLTRDPALLQGHSRRDAAVAPGEPFPIVLIRAGGSAGVLNYSSLAEDLASHGFVVVGFDAPYRTGLVTFPDGRALARPPENNPEACLGRPYADQERCVAPLLDAWVSDMQFVLDRLTALNASAAPGRFAGRLDMSRVGAFGHSLGGATVAEFCRRDARCRAGADIDGALHGAVIRDGLRQPFMLLLSDHSAEKGPETDQITADIQSFYERLQPESRLWLDIPGSFHFMFSDDGVVMKSAAVRGALHILGRLQIDARRQLAATSYCLQAFFTAYLKGPTSAPPAIPSPLAPEIRVVRREPR
jgi:hypothetical protein